MSLDATASQASRGPLASEKAPTHFHAGTIVTGDYLPWARVLAQSFAAHHPEVPFAVLVLDEPDPQLLRSDDGFELLSPADVGLDPVECAWMAAIYDGFELSCAVKPWLLRTLLSDADAALYLDSDILVCDSLESVADRAAESGIVLSPHTLEPPAEDWLSPAEEGLLRLGQFNAGFLAVGPDAHPFLDWWGSRLARQCVRETPDNPLRFVDQRWLDLAVNYFEIDVLRDRGANVAYWNLGSRRLEHSAGGYLVDGQPLRFMHFSGFDPAAPEALTVHPTRVDMQRSPALRRLCAEYAHLLASAGWRPANPPERVSELAGGVPLSPPIRASLRAALVESEQTGDSCRPDPRDGDALWAWLREPVTAAGTSRYLCALRASHPAVGTAFAQVPGPDEDRYRSWATGEGVARGLVPAVLLQAPARAPSPRATPSPRQRSGKLAVTSALMAPLERVADAVLAFASDSGGDDLAVAVAPERAQELAELIESAARERGVSLDVEIALIHCPDRQSLRELLQRADRTIDSGCAFLRLDETGPTSLNAVDDREPLSVLLLNTYPSNPPRNGGAIRIHSLWGAMPAGICASAVALAEFEGPAATMPLTRARPGFEHQVPFWPGLIETSRKVATLAGASADDLALALEATGEDPFSQALAAAVDAGVDAVVLNHPFLVRQALAAAPGVPLIYESHNVETDLKAAIYDDDAGGREAARLITELEAEACAHAELIVCCTAEDRDRLCERFGLDPERAHVIACGVSIEDAIFTPWPARALDAPRCVFTGSAHPPNVEAAEVIIQAAAALPHVGFDIVGLVADQLAGRPLPPNVALRGRVSDAEKQRIFAEAALALNPMRVGSGINMKVADYVASGLPVLTSAVGARGYVAELVDCLRQVEPQPAALAQAITSALDEDWTNTTTRARAVVEAEYDWPVLAVRYSDLLHEVLADPARSTGKVVALPAARKR